MQGNGTTIPDGAGFLSDLAIASTALNWVVDRILPEGAVVIVAGLPKKAKKTWLAMHLGICVSQGLPFLGRRTSARRVVYSFLEDGKIRIGQRARALGISSQTHPKIPFLATYTEDAFREHGKRIAETKDPILWIIDPLIEVETLHNVNNENDAPTIARLVKGYRKIAQANGHTIVFTHHFRKQGDLMRGSGALSAACDGWWNCEPGLGGVRVSAVLRDGNGEDPIFGFDLVDGPAGRLSVCIVDPPPVPVSAEVQRHREQVIRVLRRSHGERWSQESLAAAAGLSRDQVRAILPSLEEDEMIARRFGPKGGYMAGPALLGANA